jgi:hypothetical protein
MVSPFVAPGPQQSIGRRLQSIGRRLSLGRLIMSNALNRMECYRNLAEECHCLAATTFSTQMRSRYLRMAEIYTMLAEAEETRSASLLRLAAPVSSQKSYRGKLSADKWRLAHAAHH